MKKHCPNRAKRLILVATIILGLAFASEAQAAKFCLCVFGQTSAPMGKGTATVQVNGQNVEVDLSTIKSLATGGDITDRSQAETFVEVARLLREKIKEKLGEPKVGPLLNGNCFTVEADNVTVAGTGAPQEPDLAIKVQAGECLGVSAWSTASSIPFVTQRTRKPVPDLSFTETEVLDANGDLVSCITIMNESKGDLTIKGPIFLMLNWYDEQGRTRRTEMLPVAEPCPDNLTFSCVKDVRVPKKGTAGDKTTSTQGNATIEVDPAAGTAKICWRVKKADFATKLPGFDLKRKYLAYIDFFSVEAESQKIVPINYWVKPRSLQKDGSEQCYNWYPTNPSFSTSAISMQFFPDQNDLPADWEVTAQSPGPDEILFMGVEEMQAGFFCVRIPPNSPCPYGRLLLVGVDPLSGRILMVDNTEIFKQGGSSPIDSFPPLCRNSLPQTNALGQSFITITAQDLGSGLGPILPVVAENVSLHFPLYIDGTHSPVVITATKLDQLRRSQIELKVVDLCRNSVRCDPIITLQVRENGKPVSETFIDIPREESRIYIENGSPGLNHLEVIVNGTKFKLDRLTDGASRALDVSSAMLEGGNLITLRAYGKPGGSAAVMISN